MADWSDESGTYPDLYEDDGLNTFMGYNGRDMNPFEESFSEQGTSGGIDPAPNQGYFSRTQNAGGTMGESNEASRQDSDNLSAGAPYTPRTPPPVGYIPGVTNGVSHPNTLPTFPLQGPIQRQHRDNMLRNYPLLQGDPLDIPDDIAVPSITNTSTAPSQTRRRGSVDYDNSPSSYFTHNEEYDSSLEGEHDSVGTPTGANVDETTDTAASRVVTYDGYGTTSSEEEKGHDIKVEDFEERFKDPMYNGLKPDPETGLYFNSLSDALARFQEQPRWKGPQDVHLPLSDDKQVEIVKRIREAILNTTDTKDTRASSYRRRWGGGSFYDVPAVDVVAWAILHQTMHLHMVGWTLPILDPTMVRLPFVDKKLGFTARINAIVKLFRHWKCSCVSAMKGEKIFQFVAGPVKQYTRNSGNSKGNAARGEHIRLGKATKGEQSSRRGRKRKVEESEDAEVSEDGESSEEAEGTPEATPPPAKRIRNRLSRAEVGEEHGDEDSPVERRLSATGESDEQQLAPTTRRRSYQPIASPMVFTPLMLTETPLRRSKRKSLGKP
ncbi:hypothetical protein AOQ84DRAFT_375619 [Glonium stellatum]|uniref:Uncharacterized protein n=1 Tax=Glonium stellatum TaxID=574774 RepID=A0A8E2JUG4_9PEZI|nr:hypothetical protein AOQ84DRAFT_375619 [Glonium stellatum]